MGGFIVARRAASPVSIETPWSYRSCCFSLFFHLICGGFFAVSLTPGSSLYSTAIQVFLYHFYPVIHHVIVTAHFGGMTLTRCFCPPDLLLFWWVILPLVSSWDTWIYTHSAERRKKIHTYWSVKGILWDRQWSPPALYQDISPQMQISLQKCISIIMKLSNLPSFRAIRAPIALQSTFDKLFSYFLIAICISFYTSSGVFLHVIFWE